MALSTNKNVWKVMAFIAVVLVLFTLLFFYFATLAITFVVGILLIIITERLGTEYSKSMAKYKIAKKQRRFYGYVLLIFWLFIFGFLLINSIDEIRIALETNPRLAEGPIIANYVMEAEGYLPEGVANRVDMQEVLRASEKYIFSFISGFFASLGTFVFNAVLIIPLLFYMYFRRRKQITQGILDCIPKHFHNGTANTAHDIGKELHDYFEGKIVESTVVGAICCFGFFILGVKGWLFLGVLAGFLNIVPYVGPALGAVGPILITLLLEEPIIVILTAIVIVIAQLVDNLYLIPFMISGKVRMDPLLSIVLILVGAQVFGAMGMIFAIPIYIVFKVVLRESYQELVKLYGRG